MTDAQLAQLVLTAAQALRAAGKRIAVAESCTGGWLAKALTDVAGSSHYFELGVVTYSNAAKRALLGVPDAVLAVHGAVSRETVLQMAAGALRISGADVAVAVSGIAGPDGGTAEKPVGLVWFALASRTTAPRAEERRFQGDREAVRRAAVALALQMIAAAVC
ncbi:MAG: CinA family protein [Steroidobacterales bacterium]